MEALPSREIDVHVDEVAVALDVAVLAADDQDHELLVAPVRDLAVGGRLDVDEAACGYLVLLIVGGKGGYVERDGHLVNPEIDLPRRQGL